MAVATKLEDGVAEARHELGDDSGDKLRYDKGATEIEVGFARTDGVDGRTDGVARNEEIRNKYERLANEVAIYH